MGGSRASVIWVAALVHKLLDMLNGASIALPHLGKCVDHLHIPLAEFALVVRQGGKIGDQLRLENTLGVMFGERVAPHAEKPAGAFDLKISDTLHKISEDVVGRILCPESRNTRVTSLQGFDSRFQILVLVCVR